MVDFIPYAMAKTLTTVVSLVISIAIKTVLTTMMHLGCKL